MPGVWRFFACLIQESVKLFGSSMGWVWLYEKVSRQRVEGAALSMPGISKTKRVG